MCEPTYNLGIFNKNPSGHFHWITNAFLYCSTLKSLKYSSDGEWEQGYSTYKKHSFSFDQFPKSQILKPSTTQFCG